LIQEIRKRTKAFKITTMIDQIINSVKSELSNKLLTLGLPSSKTGAALDLAKEVIMGKISAQASGANTSGLMNMFNSKQPLDQSVLVQNMMSDYGSVMTSKFGVGESVSKSVSTFIIPFIMSKLSNTISLGGPEALQSLIKGNGTLGKLKSMGGNFMKSVLFF
jgi:hypothetical protein